MEQQGFTKHNNSILDALIELPFNTTQLKILLATTRFTDGYNRECHSMSESFMSKITGISKRYISLELKKLIEWNIVSVVKESTFTESRQICVNKNVTDWKLPQVKSASTGEVKFTSTVEDSFTWGDEVHFTGGVEASFHHINKDLNKTLNKNIKKRGENDEQCTFNSGNSKSKGFYQDTLEDPDIDA